MKSHDPSQSRFWWERYPITKDRREWTALRLKAAERAVKKEADRMPLFPELRKFHNVEQRVELIDQRSEASIKRLRDGRAASWKQARAFLRSLPASDRQRLLAKWNQATTPGGPADLFAVAKMMNIITHEQTQQMINQIFAKEIAEVLSKKQQKIDQWKSA